MSLLKKITSNLKNHKVEETGVYRLKLVHIWKYTSIVHNSFYHINNYNLNKFTAPNGMVKEDVFKVMSYLYDLLKKNLQFSHEVVYLVNCLNDILPYADFEYVPYKDCKDSKSLDLMVVSGSTKQFKKSKDYKNFFKWYTSNVKKEEIEKIYSKIGKDFNVESILNAINYKNKTV